MLGRMRPPESRMTGCWITSVCIRVNSDIHCPPFRAPATSPRPRKAFFTLPPGNTPIYVAQYDREYPERRASTSRGDVPYPNHHRAPSENGRHGQQRRYDPVGLLQPTDRTKSIATRRPSTDKSCGRRTQETRTRPRRTRRVPEPQTYAHTTTEKTHTPTHIDHLQYPGGRGATYMYSEVSAVLTTYNWLPCSPSGTQTVHPSTEPNPIFGQRSSTP